MTTTTVAARGIIAALLVMFDLLAVTMLAVGAAGGHAPIFGAADNQSIGTVKWSP